MSKTQAIIIVSLLTAIALAIGAFFVIFFNKNTETPPPSLNTPVAPASVNSYQACVDAGNSVQESYPEVCAVPGGKSFTNPEQSL